MQLLLLSPLHPTQGSAGCLKAHNIYAFRVFPHNFIPFSFSNCLINGSWAAGTDEDLVHKQWQLQQRQPQQQQGAAIPSLCSRPGLFGLYNWCLAVGFMDILLTCNFVWETLYSRRCLNACRSSSSDVCATQTFFLPWYLGGSSKVSRQEP